MLFTFCFVCVHLHAAAILSNLGGALAPELEPSWEHFGSRSGKGLFLLFPKANLIVAHLQVAAKFSN